MRVAMLAGSFCPSHDGVADYADRLRWALEGRGDEVTILATREAAATAGDPAVLGVTAEWGPRSLPQIVQALQQEPYDLLHIQQAPGSYHFRRSLFFLPPLLRASGWTRPIVTTLHEYGTWPWTWRGIPLHLLFRAVQRFGWADEEAAFLLTWSDAIITTNRESQGVLADRLPSLCERMIRIPLAMNITRTSACPSVSRRVARERLNWPQECGLLAFFGFVHPVKGLETLLHAFALLHDARPQLRLAIVGGVESLALKGREAAAYRASLERLIAGLGLEDCVRLTGRLPDEEASIILSGADIGVLPFNHGCTMKSGSLLTMLAHGLPVVTTPYEGGAKPPLDRDGLVRLAPRRDPQGLARVISQLVDDDTARRRLRNRGLAASKRRTWPAIAAEHHDLYARLVRRHIREKSAA